jgi:predicted RNA binding protein YcfA (HicA-like mRNA interferase family)
MVMPKPQKYRDVARFLRSQGWFVLRQPSGSHVVWSSADGRTFSIARHREVSVGVIRELLREFPDSTPNHWR